MKTLTRWRNYVLQNINLLGVAAGKVEVWLENGKPVSGGFHETEQGIKYIDFEYRACLAVEEMPHEQGGLLTLMAYNFVDGLDRRDLEEIDISITPLDDGKTVNIEITFGVRDEIYVTEVQHSPVLILGKKMGFAKGSWNVAETISVKNAENNG